MNRIKIMVLTAFILTGMAHYLSAYDEAKPAAEKSGEKAPMEKKAWELGDPITFDNGKGTFSVEERLRFEVRSDNFDFSPVEAITDDEYLLQRLRISLGYKPNPSTELFIQMQDSREVDSLRGDDPGIAASEGDQNATVRQAYISLANYKECPWGVKFGRQELSYGDERLIGAFAWNNIGRAFDGGKLRYQVEDWNIDAFAVLPVSQYSTHFDVPDEDDRFFGIYGQTKLIQKHTTEGYVLFRNKVNNDSGFPTGGSNIGTNLSGTQAGTQMGDYTTIGTRFKSAPGLFAPWDYELELAGQIGSIVANSADSSLVNSTTTRQNLEAFAAHVAGGYTFPGKSKLRVGAEYNFATGDDNPTDGDNHSFQNLFPTNHKFYGYMDAFAWRNMHNARLQFNITVLEKLGFQMDYHAFWIAENDDAWFRANAFAQVRGVGAGATARSNADSFAGHELDFTFNYPITKWMAFNLGYSHFIAGEYLSDTGASSDADFTYIQTTFKF